MMRGRCQQEGGLPVACYVLVRRGEGDGEERTMRRGRRKGDDEKRTERRWR